MKDSSLNKSLFLFYLLELLSFTICESFTLEHFSLFYCESSIEKSTPKLMSFDLQGTGKKIRTEKFHMFA